MSLFVLKETILSTVTVVVAHKSAGVRTKLSFQVLAVPQDGYNIFVILYCGVAIYDAIEILQLSL